jgi:hypothetical protein
MNRWRVGEDRGSKETDGCFLTEAVKAVRTCQNSLGQDGTCLGLLLLHVGPNGDGFGGQAFMEHYNGIREGHHSLCGSIQQDMLCSQAVWDT